MPPQATAWPSEDDWQKLAWPPQATARPSEEDWQKVALPPQATARPSEDDWQKVAWPPQATAWPSLEDWQNVAWPPQATAWPSLEDWQMLAPVGEALTVCWGVPVAITQPAAAAATNRVAAMTLMRERRLIDYFFRGKLLRILAQ
jgi:hypothetical protein